jgi:Fe-S cluster assembly ATP-binding protein
MTNILEIKNLSVSIGDKELLHDINMTVTSGARHHLAGANGSGKSTLVGAISGALESGGQIIFNGADITDESVTTRALMGIFTGAQIVPEIPGLTVTSFLKHSASAHAHFNTGKALNLGQFLKDLEAARTRLDIPKSWLARSINVGFSGGERKRLMLLRLLMTKPIFAMLDEPDSGADAATKKLIAEIIHEMKDTTFLFISHQNDFADMVGATETTTLKDGRVVV